MKVASSDACLFTPVLLVFALALSFAGPSRRLSWKLRFLDFFGIAVTRVFPILALWFLGPELLHYVANNVPSKTCRFVDASLGPVARSNLDDYRLCNAVEIDAHGYGFLEPVGFFTSEESLTRGNHERA